MYLAIEIKGSFDLRKQKIDLPKQPNNTLLYYYWLILQNYPPVLNSYMELFPQGEFRLSQVAQGHKFQKSLSLFDTASFEVISALSYGNRGSYNSLVGDS